MLGVYETDENGQTLCPKCKQPMLLKCYGMANVCEPCDYVELASDWLKFHKEYADFIKQFSHHSNFCLCKICIEKYGPAKMRIIKARNDIDW